MAAEQKFRSIVLSVLAAGVGLFAAYYYWTTTPTYAVYQLAEAVREKNPPLFYQYFDVERVVESVVSGAATSETSGLGALGSAIGVGLNAIINPQLSKMVKLQIDRSLGPTPTTGSLNDMKVQEDKLGKVAEPLRFTSFVKSFDTGRITRNGSSAVAEFHLTALNRPYIVMLKMEDRDGWKVVGIENMAAILDKFAQDQKEVLAEKNAAIRQEMANHVRLGKLEMAKESAWLGLERAVKITLILENIGEATIFGASLEVAVLDANKKVLAHYPIDLPHADIPAKGQKTFDETFKLKLFDDKSSAVFKAENFQLQATIERLDVDGRPSLRAVKDLDELH